MEAAVKTVLCAVAVLLVCATSASAQLGEYNACEAAGSVSIVAVSRANCQEVGGTARAVDAAPPGEAASVLRAAGWTPLRSAATDGGGAFDLVAVRGRAA